MKMSFGIILRVAVIFGLIFSQAGLRLSSVTAAPARSVSALSGRVTDGHGNGIEGVTVSAVPEFWLLYFPLVRASGSGVTLPAPAGAKAPLNNPVTTTLTDANGNYIFPALIDGSYTLSASKGALIFIPASRKVTLPTTGSQDFQLETVNHAPDLPANPSPADGAAQVSVTPALTWTGGDPDGDAVLYDIYFEAGDPSPDILAVVGQSSTAFSPGTLEFNTTYFWQVIAADPFNETTAGPVWTFTTRGPENQAPHQPANPAPADGASGVALTPSLTWTGGDPDGDAVLYDVYFEADDASPDALLSADQAGLSFAPGTLATNTIYYWQIVASDSHALATTGPVWQFTTGSAPNQAPDPPSDPDPVDGASEVTLTPTLAWTGSDPDGDALTYDLFLEPGDQSPDVLVETDLAAAAYAPGALEEGTTYYWSITARDEEGLTTSGPVWSFTTQAGIQPPGVDVRINAQDGPLTFNSLDTFTVTWSSQNADSCTGSEALAGQSGLSGSVNTGPLADGQYTFRMTCTNSGGSQQDQVVVTITDLPADHYLAAGGAHSCGITVAGGVKCWGMNESGQLGNGQMSAAVTSPVDVLGLAGGVQALDAGDLHTCAVTQAGGAKCWGANLNGELGNNSEDSSATPVDVYGLATGVTSIAAGGNHACALTQTGGVKCWGSNLDGELGDGSTFSSSVPVDVIGLEAGVQAVATGFFHTCALTGAGGVKCWGWNFFGQLGNNSDESSAEPVDVDGLGSGVLAIAAGDYHTCALTQAGSVRCWGQNEYGQLGDNSTTSRSTPVVVSNLTGARGLSAGGYHTCALTANHGLVCWGLNEEGQLGDNSTTNRGTPAAVSGFANGARAIAAGGFHACAISQVGGVWCWGLNETGQLGDGSTTNRLAPVSVPGLP